MLEEEAKQQVSAFLSLHEERVRVYKRLDSGHRQLLGSAGSQSTAETPPDPFPAYRDAVAEATSAFASVSQRVLALLVRLRGQPMATQCVKAIEHIQEFEKEKLQLTCELHLLAFQERTESEDPMREAGLRERRKRHARLIDDINECILELREELYD